MEYQERACKKSLIICGMGYLAMFMGIKKGN